MRVFGEGGLKFIVYFVYVVSCRLDFIGVVVVLLGGEIFGGDGVRRVGVGLYLLGG